MTNRQSIVNRQSSIVNSASALLMLFAADVAVAQTLDRPRVEIGASIGTIGVFAEGHRLFTTGLRATVNITDRTAVELTTDALNGGFFDNLHGLYIVQVRRAFHESASSQTALFATAGFGGAFSYVRSRDYRFTRPDGSVVVYPSRREGELTRPIFLAGGVGVERVVARFAAVRGDVQAVYAPEAGADGFGVRLAAGLSIPIGSYRWVRQ